MAFITLALSLLLLVDYTKGGCGNCQDNYVACQSLTTFSICIDGKSMPIEETVHCPIGTVCTDKSIICIENTNSSYVASCGIGCEVCNSHDRVFSCLGRREVAFCFGETLPFYSAIATCPDGYVCDLSSRSICVRKDYSLGSCDREYSSSETTTDLPIIEVTTSPSVRDAKAFCRENAMQGTFPAEGDNTCKRYYICKAINNGQSFMGYSFSCNAKDYFDPVKRYCTKERPSSCR